MTALTEVNANNVNVKAFIMYWRHLEPELLILKRRHPNKPNVHITITSARYSNAYMSDIVLEVAMTFNC